jgi:hypothetical protein
LEQNYGDRAKIKGADGTSQKYPVCGSFLFFVKYGARICTTQLLVLGNASETGFSSTFMSDYQTRSKIKDGQTSQYTPVYGDYLILVRKYGSWWLH